MLSCALAGGVPSYSGSAITRAPPAKAAARILSPAGLEAWWIGRVRIESVDADWPSVGSRMRWRAGGAFEAEVVENALPARLVTKVVTPSGRGTITHTFTPTPEGTRYEKTVDSVPEGIVARLFFPLLGVFVRREVKRAAADADARA